MIAQTGLMLAKRTHGTRLRSSERCIQVGVFAPNVVKHRLLLMGKKEPRRFTSNRGAETMQSADYRWVQPVGLKLSPDLLFQVSGDHTIEGTDEHPLRVYAKAVWMQ